MAEHQLQICPDTPDMLTLALAVCQDVRSVSAVLYVRKVYCTSKTAKGALWPTCIAPHSLDSTLPTL
jgi:hypothetical protein